MICWGGELFRRRNNYPPQTGGPKGRHQALNKLVMIYWGVIVFTDDMLVGSYSAIGTTPHPKLTGLWAAIKLSVVWKRYIGVGSYSPVIVFGYDMLGWGVAPPA